MRDPNRTLMGESHIAIVNIIMVDTAGKHRGIKNFFDWSGTAKCRASKFLLLTNDGEY
jgi:hypothetical protein